MLSLRSLMRCSTRALHTTAPRPAIYEGGISDTIGNTPVVRCRNIEPAGRKVYAKCEYFNPLSSVKDRLALGIIDHAERTGALKPGQTVVEATSGNTGIAMAMICAQRGYPCVITMAESFSIERRKTMRMLGAKVVLTPAAQRGSGMVMKAKELADKHGWYFTRQFENEANPAFHAQTTGPEILSDFAGLDLDYWVTGWGTGGTLQGAGKVLKLARPEIKIIAAEPANAAISSAQRDGTLQERNPDGSATVSHPNWEPHPIQGWTPDFVPIILENALNMDVVDEIMQVTGEESIATSKLLASREGIFTGISGGASMAVALRVAAAAPAGSTVLTMLPDTAERYLSTPLFASIDADMNAAEIEVSQSTPNFQLMSE